MTFSFSGPAAYGLVPAVAGSLFLGYVYTNLAHTNDSPILILMGREIAGRFFYGIASNFASDSRGEAKIYAATNLIVNIATLIVFRRLQLIGNIGTAVFAGLMAIEMACKWADFSKYRTVQMG